MAPTIRPYLPTDRAAMVTVYYRAIREGTAAFLTEAERAAWAPSPTPNLTEPDKLLDQWCYVAEEAGQVTGFMSMDPSGYLDMAFVLPEVMGKGTAAALYDTLMDHAKDRGVTHFTVVAAPQSNRFLLRRGWQTDRFERMPADGQIYDIFHMSLTL